MTPSAATTTDSATGGALGEMMTTAAGTEQRDARASWADGHQHDASTGDATPRAGLERTGGRRKHGRTDGNGLATALGWFSIGLGLAQITAPRRVARMIGVSDDHTGTMRAIGVRELTAGVGILSSKPQPATWVWSRVAGDFMDLTLLGRSMSPEGAENGRTTAATAAVLGVTALDVLCGQQLTRGRDQGRQRMQGARSRQQDSSVHVEQSITINRAPDEVYGFWHNFENLPRFMRHLESVQVTGGRRSHWKAVSPAVGTTIEWDAEMTEDLPNELIAWRSLPDSEVENWGTVRFRPAPGNRGTELAVDIRYSPPGGKVTARLAKLFNAVPGITIERDLHSFKQVMETGEVVLSDATVEPGPHPAQPVGGNR